MIKNNLFRILLAIQTIGLLVYTYWAIQQEGSNWLRIAISNVQSFSWSGQFNLDFLCYLTLSGLWIMWRDKFSGKSILIGVVAMLLGILFFAPYLLWLLGKARGDMKYVMVGDR